MSTRLYMNGGATAIAPAIDASWEVNIGGRGPLTPTTPLGVALQNLAGATALNVPAGAVDVLLAQWISPQLVGGGTISGQIKGQMLALESAAAADLRSQIVIRVLSGDGTVVRGTLYGPDTAGLSHEWDPTTATNRQLLCGGAQTPTPVAYHDGDRLIVETGYRKTENATTSRTGTVRYGGTIGGSDLPEDETTTTDLRPWIEFADTLTFYGEVDFIAAATATVTGTSVAVNVPAGTINGDLMILSLGHAVATGLGAFTPPAGWTKLDSMLSQTNYAYRIAASEPASYTVSWGTSGDCAVGITTWRGQDATDPILALGLRGAGSATSWACQPLLFLTTNFTEFTHCALGRGGANVQLTVPSGESQAYAAETSGTSNAAVSTKAGYRKRSPQETVAPGNYTTSTIGTAAQLCTIAIRPAGGRFPLAERSVNVPQNGSGTSFTPLAPPDYHAGDLLVAIVGYSRQATTAENVTPPTGWSQAGATTKLENIHAGIGNPSSLGMAVFYKKAAGGDSFAWTFASSQTSIKIQIVAFSAKPTAPSLVVAAIAADGSNNTTQTVPALTLADFADDVLLLACQLLDGGPNGFSIPAGYQILLASMSAGVSPANELDTASRTYSTTNPPSVNFTTVNNRFSIDCQIAIAAQLDGVGARRFVVMV